MDRFQKMNEAGGVSALVTRRVDGDVKQISKITTMVSDQSGDVRSRTFSVLFSWKSRRIGVRNARKS